MDYSLDDVEAGRIGDLVPGYHVRFSPAEAERLKVEAKKRGRSLPLTRYTSSPAEGQAWLERARLAFHGMVALADHYGVLGKVSDRSGDVRLTSGASLSQPKSLRHRDLQRYEREGRDLFTPWPVDRRIGDYIVARSVMTNPDGSSSVFVWGALARDYVRHVMPMRPHQRPRARGGSPYIRLMLAEYDAGELAAVLGDYDLLDAVLGDDAP